jgi:formate hydrogenlyase subunit 4
MLSTTYLPSVPGVVAWIALLAASPLVPGVAARTRAFLTGRRGAPPWQLYSDLWKLLRRGVVYAAVTTWIFRVAPLLLLAAVVVATMLLPLDGERALVAFSGDAVAFVYLLGLARFAIVLAALDTGSSFEGMGASREVTFASLVEPSLFVSLIALGIATGQLSLSGMTGPELLARWGTVAPTILLLAGSVFVLMLAECSRVPVDDPTTHLELTMVHEVMVLDHAGPDLACVLYANALKLGAFAAIILSLLLPGPARGSWFAVPLLLAALILAGLGIGIVESTVARLRLPKVPIYIASGGALGFLGLLLLLQ